MWGSLLAGGEGTEKEQLTQYIKYTESRGATETGERGGQGEEDPETGCHAFKWSGHGRSPDAATRVGL